MTISTVHTKICSKCSTAKPLTEFHRLKTSRDGRMPYCKPCNVQRAKRWNQENPEKHLEGVIRWQAKNPGWVRGSRIIRHGISPEMYDALLARQDGKCAGCGATECSTGKRFSIDHDHSHCQKCDGSHSCGQSVRALLCSSCNLRDVMAGHPPVDWPSVMAA